MTQARIRAFHPSLRPIFCLLVVEPRDSAGRLPCAWPSPGARAAGTSCTCSGLTGEHEVCAWTTRPADPGLLAAEVVFTHGSQEEGAPMPGRTPGERQGPSGVEGTLDETLHCGFYGRNRRGGVTWLGDSAGLWEQV